MYLNHFIDNLNFTFYSTYLGIFQFIYSLRIIQIDKSMEKETIISKENVY